MIGRRRGLQEGQGKLHRGRNTRVRSQRLHRRLTGKHDAERKSQGTGYEEARKCVFWKLQVLIVLKDFETQADHITSLLTALHWLPHT